MKTLSRFVTEFTTEFTNLILAVLSSFDRVIFKGYLPTPSDPHPGVGDLGLSEGFFRNRVVKLISSKPRSCPTIAIPGN
jgi:hypothetical protein